MSFLFWLVAVVLVIAGIIQILEGAVLFGILLVIVGLAVGPGGWSVTRPR